MVIEGYGLIYVFESQDGSGVCCIVEDFVLNLKRKGKLN